MARVAKIWQKVPKHVIPEEPKQKTQQDQLRGRTKVTVLTNNPDIMDLVAFSVYDSISVRSSQWPTLRFLTRRWV